jgi:hypothetical protein
MNNLSTEIPDFTTHVHICARTAWGLLTLDQHIDFFSGCALRPMGQNVSGAWLSVPLAEELLAELEQYTLEADRMPGKWKCRLKAWFWMIGTQAAADCRDFAMCIV